MQRTLLGLLSAVQDAETGQRGYLLTGDLTYLDPYRTARTNADSLLDRLDGLVSWNPVQVRRVPSLRAAVSEKMAELDETVRLYDNEGAQAALEVVQTDRGQQAMDDIRSLVGVMIEEARRVRGAFAGRADRAARNARRAAWASTGALGALLILLGLGVRTAGRRRERDAERLTSSNAALSSALAEREAALARVRAMQARLVQQEKLAGMGRLTSGIAHELKNPLNFVNNFAVLTAEMADEAAAALDGGDVRLAADLLAAVHQNADKVRQHGSRADKIVRAMEVHAQGVTGVPRNTDLEGVVRAAVAQAGGPGGFDGLEVAVEVAPGLGPVPVVAESVTRAVRNLVENAAHAVLERAGAGDPAYRPEVRVSVHRGADHDGRPAAVVTVADNGPGITDAALPRIFEPFFTTRAPGSGTGLGLSLAHDIAVGHGGALLAERPPGGGAAFVLTLPLEAGHVEDVSPAEAP